MAKVTLNSSINGLRGRLDRWVYRQQNGQTVVSPFHPPPPGEEPVPSAHQLSRRARFAQAAEYAKNVLADPLHKELYRALAKQRNQTLQSLLIQDFLNPPEISVLDLAAYQGRAGDLIRIVATDDIEVVSVSIIIRDASGTALEQGSAMKYHELWQYKAQTDLPPGTTVRIEALATDRPGHTGREERNFPS